MALRPGRCAQVRNASCRIRRRSSDAGLRRIGHDRLSPGRILVQRGHPSREVVPRCRTSAADKLQSSAVSLRPADPSPSAPGCVGPCAAALAWRSSVFAMATCIAGGARREPVGTADAERCLGSATGSFGHPGHHNLQAGRLAGLRSPHACGWRDWTSRLGGSAAASVSLRRHSAFLDLSGRVANKMACHVRYQKGSCTFTVENRVQGVHDVRGRGRPRSNGLIAEFRSSRRAPPRAPRPPSQALQSNAPRQQRLCRRRTAFSLQLSQQPRELYGGVAVPCVDPARRVAAGAGHRSISSA